MAKISPVAAKYIIHANIQIDGIVDRPDVIGAIFGQTEGLLGNELELRELQRSGKIGRIEVNVNTAGGKTKGEIVIPSSLDKTETAIAAAALEIIQRIGPCNAKIDVKTIEDIRVSKRSFVIERAKVLLKELTEKTLPDSQELSYEVAESVRMMEIVEYGRDRLAAGPAIEESDEIIIVEGRADVLVLLKHGFKNVISMNGTSCPQTIKELTRKKSATVFVDGDRGGDLIIRELLSVGDIDFVCKAPDGKEVEELTKKEIHKCLRSRITSDQARLDLGVDSEGALVSENGSKAQANYNHAAQSRIPQRRMTLPLQNGERLRQPYLRSPPASSGPLNGSTASSPLQSRPVQKESRVSAEEGKIFKETLENLFGTRGACIFDQKLNVLGKVPLSELVSTVKSLNGGIYAVALDGAVDIDLLRLAEKYGINHLIGTASKVREASKVNVIADEELQA